MKGNAVGGKSNSFCETRRTFVPGKTERERKCG